MGISSGLQYANIMATLQRLINKQHLDERELKFCSRTLDHLATISGKHIKLESWMVTSYEVDFGNKIGEGGLYVQVLYA
jgi:hypothetical protein